MKPECVIVDIDGTLANNTWREHYIQQEPKDWQAFFAASGEDPIIPHIRDLVGLLNQDYRIVLVTGRSENYRDVTENWLDFHNVPWATLFMRPEGDHRPDWQVKAEILEQHILPHWTPIMALDDRNSVVAMWRAKGIPCLQVAEGDF